MMTTTATLDCQSNPNHITMIGATPMIGSAETTLPSGSSPRLRNGTASARIATAKPSAEPSAQPVITDLRKVWTKSAASVGAKPAIAAPMREGGGISTEGTPNPTTSHSHTTKRKAPNRTGT